MIVIFSIMLLFAFGISALLAHRMIGYAHRHNILDHPGQRRSHRTPTPRGGGIGIVVGCALTMPIPLAALNWGALPTVAATLLFSLLLIAGIGWLDDRHSLSVCVRLLVQALAVGLFTVAMIYSEQIHWFWLLPLLFTGLWSTNLHNFMDGIDGLLAQQAIFVATGIGLLAMSAGQLALAASALCMAAATLGFWLFNRHPARIFMGDVGSGSLGFLIYALIALPWTRDTELLWPALTLCSAFVTDSTLTLLLRISHGKRWYAAHREHLYQWLARSRSDHAGSVRVYLGWNVFVAAPMAFVATLWRPGGWLVCLSVYALAAWLWLASKRNLLSRRRHGGHHASA